MTSTMLPRWTLHVSSSMDFALFIILLTVCHIIGVSGHGRLLDPPSRSTMWREGFSTERNYNDNELFCGGFTVQWKQNGGKCGICGDNYRQKQPRDNEAGGKYGKGIIVRKYKPGQVINAKVQLTANHKGFFEFKLCPQNNPKVVATQECLDRYPLEVADGSGTRYYVEPRSGIFEIPLKLPAGLTCSQCVFQWSYTAGNNWGRCEDGTSAVGCGPQETFRGCADISIGNHGSSDVPLYNKPQGKRPSKPAVPTRKSPPWKPQPQPTTPSRPRRPTRKPYNPTTRRPAYTPKRPTRPSVLDNYPTKRPRGTAKTTTTRYPRSRSTPVYQNKPYTKSPTKKPRPTYKPKPGIKNLGQHPERNHCVSVGPWQNVPGMVKWCEVNCARGYCPSTHCSCNKK